MKITTCAVLALMMNVPCGADQAMKNAVDSKNETWICTFPSQLKGDPKPTIQKWIVSGRVMADWLFPVPVFQVLQNNNSGLIGVYSFVHVEAGRKAPSIGAYIVLLDKSTGTAVRSVTSTGNESSVWSGNCVKDSD